jgi:hypothetical protein
VEEVHLGHHRNGGHIPGRLVFLLAGDCFDSVAPFAGGLIGFDAGVMRRVIGDVHGSAAAWLWARQMFMLKGLDKAAMRLTFLFGFHRRASFPRISISLQGRHPG